MKDLNINNFRDIKIDDYAEYTSFLGKSILNPNCEQSFHNLFVWSKPYKLKICFYKNLVLTYCEDDEFISMPLGDIKLKELVVLSEKFKEEGKKGIIGNIPIDYFDKNEAEKYFEISVVKDYSDYIYSTEKFIGLSGKKLRKKRNQIKQFISKYPSYEIINLSKNRLNILSPLLTKWFDINNGEEISKEKEALNQSLNYFEELKLNGLAITINNETIAFCIYSEITEDSCMVHFEKANYEYKGVTALLNHELAKSIKYKYINREHDLGEEGLRHSKKSYDPDYLLDTYVFKLK